MQPIEIARQIEEAANTMRYLPPVAVRNTFCAWPDYIHTFADMVGIKPMPGKPRIRPTAAQLKRMDEVLIWLTWLEPKVARIVWARAEGFAWRKIAAIAGISDKTCRTHCAAGVIDIARRLNGGAVRKIVKKRAL